MLIAGPSGASEGAPAAVKMIADAKGVYDEGPGPQVIKATTFGTAIQFGDEHTLNYMRGAQTLALRYEVGASSLTVSFGGGKSLDDVIQKALKACGKEPLAPPPPVSTTAQPGSPEWKHASDACPHPYNFVADENDKWTCVNDQSGAPVRETAPLPARPAREKTALAYQWRKGLWTARQSQPLRPLARATHSMQFKAPSAMRSTAPLRKTSLH